MHRAAAAEKNPRLFRRAKRISPGDRDSVAEGSEFELPVPICEQSDDSKTSGFAAPARIVRIARGSNAGSALLSATFERDRNAPQPDSVV
jgi:hypothetical protein